MICLAAGLPLAAAAVVSPAARRAAACPAALPLLAARLHASAPRLPQRRLHQNVLRRQVVAEALPSDELLAQQQRDERALAYGGIASLLGASGLLLAVAPCKAVEFVWAACPHMLVAGLARMLGAQMILAAICAFCLKDATEKGHLKSATYKRLNLALLWWGLGSVAALWLAPQQPLRAALGVCTVVLAGTAAHAGMTYLEMEPGGLNPLFLGKEFLKSLGNLGNYKNDGNSAIVGLWTYGLAAKACVAAAAAQLLESKLRLAQAGLLLQPLGTLGDALLPLTGLGYLLVAVVMHTLKDAAARGRLGASTFKALNIGVAVLALAHAVTFALWIQAGLVVKSGATLGKVGMNLAFAGISLGYYATAKK